MTVTTYDPATGEIKAVRSGGSKEELLALIDGAAWVEGAWSPRFYRVDLETGRVVEK